jgi:hypothetical protein
MHSTIRTRKIGSNKLSDKYILPIRVEDTFMDLALFMAHTGFANVRNTRKQSDDIPIYESMEELIQNYRPNDSGIALYSLDTVWRLHNIVEDNTLWYIADESRFILYKMDGISKSVYDIISDTDDDHAMGPFQTTFRPEMITIVIDTFISRNMLTSSMCIYNALCIVIPMFMKHHGLSRNSIVNRRSKMKRNVIH